MNKSSVVLFGVMAGALGASVACNCILNERVSRMEKRLREVTAAATVRNGRKTPEAAAKSAPGKETSEKAKFRAQLPVTPILFKSAAWRADAVVLDFESEDRFVSGSFSVSPELPVKGRFSGTKIVLSGNFLPGMKYRVTIPKGAKNASGGVLENDAVAEIRIPDREPEVSFVTSGTYLSLRGGRLVLPFRTVNCGKVKVVVARAFENNLNPYVIGSHAGDMRMIRVSEKTLEFKTPKNREVFHELDLEPLIGGRKPGVYRVTLNGAEQYVFITDMALQAVEDASSGRLAVFIRSLATGKPVAGAELTVMSFKNQPAASGRTDENGSALLAYDPAWDAKNDRTVAVVARKDGDISYFLLKNARLFDRSGEAVAAGAPRAFVFAERGIARPGEKIAASVFLRREQEGTFRPMKDTELEVRLLDPAGNRMFSRAAKSGRHGFFQTEFVLPETAATGVYSIVCRAAGSQTVCGRTVIRVASYVPDRIRISGRDLSEKSGVEDMLEFEFDAKYYFGAPLENGSWQYSVRSFPGAFPAHWDKSWSVGDAGRFVAAEVLSGRGKKGRAPVKLRYPGFAQQNGKSFDPVRIEAVFEASEPGGRAVTGKVARQLYPTPFFIGLRETKGNGREKRFEYTLLPSGECDSLRLADAFDISFELVRKEWEYVLSRDGGTWKRRWVRREIPLPDRKKSVSLPAGDFTVGKAAAVSWSGLPSGEYTLTARSGEDHLTKLDFSWYAGEGGERSADPNSLYFRTDAEEVPPGGTLTFSFDAPGDGEAFLVCGERSLADRRTLAVRTGRNTVTVKVPRNIHSSGYFVGCTVVTRRGGNWLRSFGLLRIRVDQTRNHRLSVALEHPEKAEPGAEFPVRVTLKDASGKPRAGAVCLYAADSGALSLTEYKTPDIFGCFYGDIACPMKFYDMYGLLFEDLRITPDGRIGGDAAMARKLGRIKQKHTARLIVPLLEVPASGSAGVKVRLPDHTGELTFFAVASCDDAAGSVSSPVVMRKPVTVQISAPRFVAPGDEAELAVTVFNHEAGAKDFFCTVTLLPMLKLLSGASGAFAVKDLGKGKQRTYTLKVRALERFGSGAVSALLAAGPVSAKDETFVTVRSVNVSQGAYRFVLLKPGESFKAAFAGDYIGGVTGSVRLSASPALAVKNALDWLNDYPYGCLEQTTAGAFPFISLPVLAKVGLVDEAMAKTNRHKPAAAYARLLAMALSDGSFAMWPGGARSWDEGTVFALHFIFEAEKRGQLSLDGARRRKYISWLRRQVNDADPRKRTLRAWCAYVLAVGGDRAFITASRNIIEGSEKPDYALLLAGGALVKGGYASLGAPAMRQALEARCWTEGGVPTAYSDKACRLGMALYVFMDCALPDEELAARLALELAQCIRPDGSAWGTTQANAWAALGLAAFAEKYPPLPARARVSRDGKGEEKTFSGVLTLPAKDGLLLTNTSAGTLIVESGIYGIPRKTPASGGIVRIFREYLNEKGEPVTSVRHGDKVRVRIRFETPAAVESLVIADLLPAGLEIEDELLAGRAATLPDTAGVGCGAFRPKRLEKRDDRFVAFGDAAKGRGEITYQTRAVIRGSFVVPPVHAEAMYQPDTRGIFSTAAVFTVR
ncbi:MAG: hypothetical protein IJU70_06710 [Lentisphaeria bacterium]|nr:hypothetical protein [Lentisphaeria bacterium]